MHQGVVLKNNIKIYIKTASTCFGEVTTSSGNRVKVKVTLVQALRLCTDRRAHRGSRGIALLYRH
jgi:hypothetical protein